MVYKQVGLEEKVHRLPDQLSGGEQERVSIARFFGFNQALANSPSITASSPPADQICGCSGSGGIVQTPRPG